MNQLFNPVNYFEFQAFEGLPRWQPPGVYRRKPEHHPISSLLLFPSTSYFSHRAWKQKSRRGIPARGGFWLIVNLRQVEGIERRLVDYRRRSKPLISLVSGERFPSQRSEQSIHITCVIAHLL